MVNKDFQNKAKNVMHQRNN